jgi:type IV pilus assembly protein PilK
MIAGGQTTANRPAQTLVLDQGFGMNDAEFQRWVGLLEDRTGVVVAPERQQFLETNLRIRMRELGFDAFEQYYRNKLAGSSGAKEWATLIDRLTVHETSFFRHVPSMELVAEVVLPDFVVRRGTQAAFHAWSVGCATGEESYSLAMVINRYAETLDKPFQFGVTGSDVSKPVLDVGRAGQYTGEQLDEVPLQYQHRYCQRINGNNFVIVERLKKRVGFAVMNLLDIKRQRMSHMDLIYCQNVLIYFTRMRRYEVLSYLVRCLRPGGFLVLGPGEMANWRHPEMDRVLGAHTSAYRRGVEGTLI